jgi:hypothetical protein
MHQTSQLMLADEGTNLRLGGLLFAVRPIAPHRKKKCCRLSNNSTDAPQRSVDRTPATPLATSLAIRTRLLFFLGFHRFPGLTPVIYDDYYARYSGFG